MSQKFIDLIRRGQTTEVAAWVEEEPEIAESRDAQGVSALMWSIYTGQILIRDFLLSGLPELDAFEAAAVGNAARLARWLEEQPAALTAFSPDGWPLLHLAAAFGTPETVQLLLERGADPLRRSTNAMGNQALHAALGLGRNPETLRALIAHGADVHAIQAGGFTPLHQAAAAGDAEAAAILLAAGADPAKRCDRDKTPADYARERGHTEVLALLESR